MPRPILGGQNNCHYKLIKDHVVARFGGVFELSSKSHKTGVFFGGANERKFIALVSFTHELILVMRTT